MKNEKCMIPITKSMLRDANMSDAEGLKITALNKAIIITEADVLDYVPEELLELFDELGISESTVRGVLSEDNGILEAFASCRE